MRATNFLVVAAAIMTSAVTAAPALKNSPPYINSEEWMDSCTRSESHGDKICAPWQPRDITTRKHLSPKLATPEGAIMNKRAENQTPGESDPTAEFCNKPENKEYPVCENVAQGNSPDTTASKKAVDSPTLLTRMDEERILSIICETPANHKYPGCKDLLGGKNLDGPSDEEVVPRMLAARKSIPPICKGLDPL